MTTVSFREAEHAGWTRRRDHLDAGVCADYKVSNTTHSYPGTRPSAALADGAYATEQGTPIVTHYVIVTGGARNIGGAIAERLTRAGLAVIVLDRDEPEHGSFHDFIRVDLVDVAALQRALAGLNTRCPATRLVNNAGMVSPARLEDADPNSVDHVMALNVRAALVCAQAVLPVMKEAGFGRIVNIASRAMQGRETRSVYAASKAALHGLTRVWALELGPFGVTANTVAPGPIRTPLFDAVNPLDSSLRESLLSDIPLRRIGEPSDVAEAVSYFMSATAGFVTGQLLYICGGLSVGRTSE